MIKKADVILLIVILIIGGAISLWSWSVNEDGDKVRITVDGDVYGTYNLSQDQEIDIQQNGHHNHITIKDGQVSMTFSDCKNQICVEEGAISQTMDSIVCLPNKVVVEIYSDSGSGEGGVDVISG